MRLSWWYKAARRCGSNSTSAASKELRGAPRIVRDGWNGWIVRPLIGRERAGDRPRLTVVRTRDDSIAVEAYRERTPGGGVFEEGVVEIPGKQL
jgi:hypothetical protein